MFRVESVTLDELERGVLTGEPTVTERFTGTFDECARYFAHWCTGEHDGEYLTSNQDHGRGTFYRIVEAD